VQGVDRLGSNLADKLSGSTMTAIARCVLAIHLGRQIG
jgi:hypothetical protein